MGKKAFITVLIADSHHLLRRGMRAMIDEQADMEVIGETSDDKKTIKIIKKLKPDVVLLDCILPGCSEENCAKLIANAKQTKIVMLSNISNINCALRMFKFGASGYLLKNCETVEVAVAIRKVFAGEVYLCKKFLQQLPGKRLNMIINKPEQLTPKEREVISIITAGHSTKKTAGFLGIESGTVITHKKRISKKLNISNDVELTKYAIRNELTNLD